MHLISRVKRVQIRLIGDHAFFSLEARIYHSICIVAFVALAYNVPFNWFVGLPWVAFISLIGVASVGMLYYLSRFKRRFRLSIIGLGIVGNVFFAMVYFLNSGIDGPTLILFALFFYLLSATAPKKQQVFWLLINLCIVAAVVVTQYQWANLVPQSYHSMLSRYTDTYSAYAVVVVSLFFSLRYLRQNYEMEKRSAINRAVDIELKNIQLELVNGEKNKLFSIVAHDLRSPLASIQSYLELLTAYALSEDEKREIELKLLSLTKNTSNMMTNLLSWSKSQLDGVKVSIQPVDLLKAIKDMLQVEASIAADKVIGFSYLINEDTYVMADANMLVVVLRNIISNAIKFTPMGGSITVVAMAGDGLCRIAITDSGTGIAEEDQADVFSLKAKSTFGTNNEKGVGLGLLLCKEFITLQDGDISFKSTPGQGTVFTISIPLAGEHEASSSPENELSDHYE